MDFQKLDLSATKLNAVTFGKVVSRARAGDVSPSELTAIVVELAESNLTEEEISAAYEELLKSAG